MTRQITYSMLTAWLSCRQKFDYRYNRQIAPVIKPTALAFGTAVHAGLEAWFKTGDRELALKMAHNIELTDVDQIKAESLLDGYIDHYATEDFTVVDIEREFDTPLVNPQTGRKSQKWSLAGKVDGIIEKDGELWILEHKTSSKVDDNYINRISIDMQIAFYAIAIQQELGKPVVGALYDVLSKPAIRLKTNESTEAFRIRCQEDVTADNFTRQYVRFADGFLILRQAIIWATVREISHASICPNTSNCLQYDACPYLSLCLCNGDMNLCADQYTLRAPHEELPNVART